MLNRPVMMKDPILARFQQAQGQDSNPETIQILAELSRKGLENYNEGLALRNEYMEFLSAQTMIPGPGNFQYPNDGKKAFERAYQHFKQAVELGDKTKLVNLAHATVRLNDNNGNLDRAAVYYRLAFDLGESRASKALLNSYSDNAYIIYHSAIAAGITRNTKKLNTLVKNKPALFVRIMEEYGDSWKLVKTFLTPASIKLLQAKDVALQVRLEEDTGLPAVIADLIIDYVATSTHINDKNFSNEVIQTASSVIEKEYLKQQHAAGSTFSFFTTWKIQREKNLRQLQRSQDTWLWSQSSNHAESDNAAPQKEMELSVLKVRTL